MVNKLNNVFLIGPMGSGKTTIGKKLANKAEKIIYRDRIIDNTVVPEDIIKTEPECTRLDGCRVLEDGTIEY